MTYHVTATLTDRDVTLTCNRHSVTGRRWQVGGGDIPEVVAGELPATSSLPTELAEAVLGCRAHHHHPGGVYYRAGECLRGLLTPEALAVMHAAQRSLDEAERRWRNKR